MTDPQGDGQKAGRPPLEKSEPTVFIGLKVPGSLKRRLEEAAKRLNLETSDLHRTVLKSYLEQFEKVA